MAARAAWGGVAGGLRSRRIVMGTWFLARRISRGPGSRECVEIVLVGGYALSVGAARFKLGYLGLACGAGVATSIFFW
jgi:hypothetical protein